MDNAYTCGCHLNHQSPNEHDRFWSDYTAKRKKKLADAEQQKKALAKPKSRSAARRLKIHKITRSSVLFTGREP